MRRMPGTKHHLALFRLGEKKKDTSQAVVLLSGFDLTNKANCKLLYLADLEELYALAEEERDKASQAEQLNSMIELENKASTCYYCVSMSICCTELLYYLHQLSSMYQNGVHINKDKYSKIDASKFWYVLYQEPSC